MIQQFLIGAPPDTFHTLPFLQKLSAHRRLCHQRSDHLQRRLHRMAVYFFYQIKLIRFPVKPFCKRPLTDTVIERTVFFPSEPLHIRTDLQRIISAHRPHQITDAVLDFHPVLRFRAGFFHQNTSPFDHSSGILVIAASWMISFS